MFYLMKRFIVFYICLVFPTIFIMAQGDIDQQGKIFYRNEKSIALLLNSNGFGLSGRYAKRIDAASKTIYDVDLVFLKHPKEVKLPSEVNPGASSFIFGKENIAMVLRPGFGKQKEIYRKFDVGGISIRRYHTFGPSVSILKPIFYEVRYYVPVTPTKPGDPNFRYEYKVEKFNDNIGSNSEIVGRSSFFKGFNEVKFIPGAYAKFGVSFEYSKLDLIIHSLDAGIIAEAFAKKLPILYSNENNQFFLTLFVSYRLGKVIDPNAIKKKTSTDDFF